jgi:hypothetical protein
MTLLPVHPQRSRVHGLNLFSLSFHRLLILAPMAIIPVLFLNQWVAAWAIFLSDGP